MITSPALLEVRDLRKVEVGDPEKLDGIKTVEPASSQKPGDPR